MKMSTVDSFGVKFTFGTAFWWLFEMGWSNNKWLNLKPQEEGVDLDEAQKRVNGVHPCARKDETQTKLRRLFSPHSDL